MESSIKNKLKCEGVGGEGVLLRLKNSDKMLSN